MEVLQLEHVDLDENDDGLNAFDFSATPVSLAAEPQYYGKRDGTRVPSSNVSSAEALSFRGFGMSSNINASPMKSPGGFFEERGDAMRDSSPSGREEELKSPWFWEIRAYQKYFNVTTSDVVGRLQLSLYKTSGDFWGNLETSSGSSVDLYGPFWIALTLIFSLGLSGNVAGRLSNKDTSQTDFWHPDLSKVSAAFTVVASFDIFIPLIMWLAFWFHGTRFRYAKLLSIQGYSMSPFVPAVLVSMIPIKALQWIMLVLAAAKSFWLLYANLKHELGQSLTFNANVITWGVIVIAYGATVILIETNFFAN